MVKLKLQYFGHLMQRADSLEKDLMLERLREGGEGSERAHLKVNIQKTKIITSGPRTSWQIDGERVETVRYFISLGSKISEDDDFSPETKSTCSLEEKL